MAYPDPVHATPEHNRATLVTYLRSRMREVSKSTPSVRTQIEIASLTQWIEFLEGLTLATPIISG